MRRSYQVVVLLLVFAALTGLACANGGNGDQNSQKGNAFVEFSFKSDDSEQPRIKPMLAFASDIAYIRLTVNPAGVNQVVYGSVPDGDVDTDEVEDGAQLFSTTINLPPGAQTFTATAYNAANAQIGVGTADATILLNQTIAVHIVILDSTGPDNPVKHAPLITSITASKRDPIQNETITLNVAATDPDNDTMTYQWSSFCGGTFTAPTAAQTDWSNPDTNLFCTIIITVSDGTFSDTASISVRVLPNSGDATVDGKFANHPFIYKISIFTDDSMDCVIEVPKGTPRANVNATCQNHFTAGRYYTLKAYARLFPDHLVTWSLGDDSCGGTSTIIRALDGGIEYSYVPAQSGVCKLTVTVRNQLSLEDSFTIAFVSSACEMNYDCPDSCVGTGYRNNGHCLTGVCAYPQIYDCIANEGAQFTCADRPARCAQPCVENSNCADYCDSANFHSGGICGSDNLCGWSGLLNCAAIYGATWFCPIGNTYCTHACDTPADCPDFCINSTTIRHSAGACLSAVCAWASPSADTDCSLTGQVCSAGACVTP